MGRGSFQPVHTNNAATNPVALCPPLYCLQSKQYASSGTARGARRLRGDNIKDGGDKPPKTATPIGRGEWGLSAVSLGRFVELYEVQVTIVALICLDLAASMAQLLPSMQNHPSPVGGEFASAGESAQKNASEIGTWTRLLLRMLQVTIERRM